MLFRFEHTYASVFGTEIQNKFAAHFFVDLAVIGLTCRS